MTIAGRAMPTLGFAEQNARELRDKLVRYSGFDAQCISLVPRPTPDRIISAITDWASVDRGIRPALFGFFYTGHAHRGGLLTGEGPLQIDDVHRAIKAVGAQIDLIWLDACNAEALAGEPPVRAQGFEPAFNPFARLDESVTTREATIWMLSSSSDQLSYEDPRLGAGIFTRYFLDGFLQANPSADRVSLRELWQYARERTVRHARSMDLVQEPRLRIVGRWSRPIEFVRRGGPRGRLVLSHELAGSYRVRHDGGSRVETVFKRPGEVVELLVAPGIVEVVESERPTSVPPQWTSGRKEWTVVATSGQTVRLGRARTTESPVTQRVIGTVVEGQPACRVVRSEPKGDRRWTRGTSTDLDLEILGHDIRMYRIRWFRAGWSQWYVPGLNDMDWKVDPADGSLRRLWTYFYDHDYEYLICDQPESNDDRALID